MRSIVIHHSADFDGLACKVVALHHLNKMGKQAVAIGWDYGQPPPPESYDLQDVDFVYLLDVSIDSEMERLAASGKLVWIDHHKSSLDKWQHLMIGGFRLDVVAACRLTWQYFTNPHEARYADFRDRRVSEPPIIRLLGEYDVFDHRDPEVMMLQHGMKGLGPGAQVSLISDGLKRFENNEAHHWLRDTLARGETIGEYVRAQAMAHARKHGYRVEFEGLNFLALNTGSPGNSQMFEGAYTDADDALLAWRWDGKQCYVSLYHRPGREDLDLTPIALKCGGGGHRGACGFRCSLSQFLKLGLAS